MADSEVRGKAWPLAEADLTNSVRYFIYIGADSLLRCLYSQILELVQQASLYKQLKKGANEGVCLSPALTLSLNCSRSSYQDTQSRHLRVHYPHR
jgi:hypothetical protein